MRARVFSAKDDEHLDLVWAKVAISDIPSFIVCVELYIYIYCEMNFTHDPASLSFDILIVDICNLTPKPIRPNVAINKFC